MKYCLLTLFALLAFTGAQANAQNKNEKNLEGAKFFIAPMEGDLHPFIAAEIVKKKLPIVVVTEEAEADYILAGASIKGDDKWFHTVIGGKDKNEGSVQFQTVSATACDIANLRPIRTPCTPTP